MQQGPEAPKQPWQAPWGGSAASTRLTQPSSSEAAAGTFGGQLRDGRRPEHQSVGAGKVAHLNVTQRSTSKQEVEV